jgi:hypothetical protein
LIRFVNRANDYARHDHFDKAADPIELRRREANPLRRAFLYKRSMRRGWLVDRADDCARNRELDQVAHNPAAEDLGRQRLYRKSNQISADIYQRYQNRERRARAWATTMDKTRTN